MLVVRLDNHVGVTNEVIILLGCTNYLLKLVLVVLVVLVVVVVV